jgi:hypothetical protein
MIKREMTEKRSMELRLNDCVIGNKVTFENFKISKVALLLIA